MKPSSSLKATSKGLHSWIAQPLQETPLLHHAAWWLLTLGNLSLCWCFPGCCYETQVESQTCRWKGLSNSIPSKPASHQRRGRHMDLILILLTLHQCISTDFEGITVDLLSIRKMKNMPLKWNMLLWQELLLHQAKVLIEARFYCNTKDLKQAQQFY